jgi:hypothetical protein
MFLLWIICLGSVLVGGDAVDSANQDCFNLVYHVQIANCLLLDQSPGLVPVWLPGMVFLFSNIKLCSVHANCHLQLGKKSMLMVGVQELLYCVQCVKFSLLPCNLYIVCIILTLKPVLCVCLNKAHFSGWDLVHKQNKEISQLIMSNFAQL